MVLFCGLVTVKGDESSKLSKLSLALRKLVLVVSTDELILMADRGWECCGIPKVVLSIVWSNGEFREGVDSSSEEVIVEKKYK